MVERHLFQPSGSSTCINASGDLRSHPTHLSSTDERLCIGLAKGHIEKEEGGIIIDRRLACPQTSAPWNEAKVSDKDMESLRTKT